MKGRSHAKSKSENASVDVTFPVIRNCSSQNAWDERKQGSEQRKYEVHPDDSGNE